MHNKAVFALAAVFLSVALIVPVVILLIQADSDLDNLIIVQNPTGTETSGNISIPSQVEIQENHNNNLIIIVVVEAVFLPLFVVTIYYGVNHVHPSHKREKD